MARTPSAKDLSFLVAEDFFDGAAARLTPQQRRQAGLPETAPITSPATGSTQPPLPPGMGGYSSLAELIDLPLDLPTDQRSARFLLGKSMGKTNGFGPSVVKKTPLGPDEVSEIKDPALGFITSEIARLEAIEEDLTQVQRERLNDLYRQKEAIEAKGAKGKFKNELLASILPSLFTQSYDQREADRNFAQTMREYQDQQQRRREQLEREQGKRQEAFALIPKLFPNLDLDLSSFGGEIDPDILPALIQMAQLRSRERMNQQQQRVARPIIRFA